MRYRRFLPRFFPLLHTREFAAAEIVVSKTLLWPSRLRLLVQVKSMFYHAFDNYMVKAYPLDEIRPKSCTGQDTLGSYSLTLVRVQSLWIVSHPDRICVPACLIITTSACQVDSLDMLALLGDRKTFTEAVSELGRTLRFDKADI